MNVRPNRLVDTDTELASFSLTLEPNGESDKLGERNAHRAVEGPPGASGVPDAVGRCTGHPGAAAGNARAAVQAAAFRRLMVAATLVIVATTRRHGASRTGCATVGRHKPIDPAGGFASGLLPLRGRQADVAFHARDRHPLQLLDLSPPRNCVGVLPIRHGCGGRSPRPDRRIRPGRQNPPYDSLPDVRRGHALGAAAAATRRKAWRQSQQLRAETSRVRARAPLRRCGYVDIP